MTFPATTIKSYFQTGDKPTQDQFIEFIDGVAVIDGNAPLSNFTANTDPTVNDDTNGGYSVGSRWVNTATREVFACTNAFAGAADWKSITNTNGVSDGDKGDIVVSSSGSVWTIDSGAVSTAKIADDAVNLTKQAPGTANRLQGFDASGNPTEVAVSGATLSAGTLTISGSGYSNNGYKSGRYYSGLAVQGSGGFAVTADRLYARPFVITNTATFDRISLSVTVGSAGSARLGIYNYANGIPTTLVADLGTISTTSTGLIALTISQSLSAGVYALAAVFSSTPSVQQTSTASSSLFGATEHFSGGSPDNTGADYYGVYKAHTYGVLPSPFGAVGATDINIPFIIMRAL